MSTVGTGALAQPQDDMRAFSLTPVVGIEGVYTDNAALVAQDRRSDVIARVMAGLQANLNHGRAVGALTAEVTYDRYARMTEFSGTSISANGAGSYSVIPGALSFHADGAITNGFTSTFGTPAVDRAGVKGRTQLALYHVGPRLNITLGDFVDVAATAQFSQVFYSAADSSAVDTPLPSDDDIIQVQGRADTGSRFAGYELLTTGVFEKDSRGYRSANGVQSAFVRVSPSVRLIARGGYESIYQPRVTDIHAAILSGGVELALNRLSKISVEGGTRYNRTTWAAKADLRLTDRFFLAALYTEAIEPDQVFVANAFREFTERAASLPPPLRTEAFNIIGNTYDQTSLNKIADVQLSYSTERQTIKVSANWRERRFLPSNTRDHTLISSIYYNRTIRPDLSLFLYANYNKTFKSPLRGKSDSYAFSGRVRYIMNSKMECNATYALSHSREFFPGGRNIRDNTVFVSIKKHF